MRSRREPRQNAERWKRWRVGSLHVSVDTGTGVLLVDGEGTDVERNEMSAWILNTLAAAGHNVSQHAILNRLVRRRD